MVDKNSLKFFGQEGILAKKLSQYEFRPQQLKMAEQIENALAKGRHLIVEAGTGTGKSLAYLVPFVYWALKEDKRVVVSTYSKALQEQLIKIDLPFLRQSIGLDFSFALCLGSNNYLCLRRLAQNQAQGLFDELKEVEQFKQINNWQKETKTGLKSELHFGPLPGVWSKVCRESDLCLGKDCGFQRECYYFKAKKKQAYSQILVANHHLFFADLASGNQVLPKFEAVVFDEAHNLEDVATNYLGLEVSNSGLKFLLDGLYNPQKGKGLIARMRKLQEELKEGIIEQISLVRNRADQFFLQILTKFDSSQKTIRLKGKNLLDNLIEEPMASLVFKLRQASKYALDGEEKLELTAFIERAEAAETCLKAIISQEMPDYVYWLELFEGHRLKRVVLHANPIQVARELKARVFDVQEVVVLTSATLATNRSFDYIKSRLGLEQGEELLLDSPFDYSKQVILYTPTSIPDPKIYPEKFQEEVKKGIEEILTLTQGRAFILFTSYSMLNKIHEQIKERLPQLNHYKQGEVMAQRMVELFKQEDKSVLWGTSTFWQGIDVPGKALVCIIITKLPFAVPDDPITEARMEFLNRQGLNPFWDYQVPQAIIQTRQGFGRLIRRKDDYGLVAILDPRIKTKSYGRLFLASLPACQQVISFDDLKKRFLDCFCPV